jgi:hypothetical protein
MPPEILHRNAKTLSVIWVIILAVEPFGLILFQLAAVQGDLSRLEKMNFLGAFKMIVARMM